MLTDRSGNIFWRHAYWCCQCEGLFFKIRNDFCSQTDLRSDLTWQIKSVISWKTTASCISKGHPLAPCARYTPDLSHTHTHAHMCNTQSLTPLSIHLKALFTQHMITYSCEGTCKKHTINCRWHMDFISLRKVTVRWTHGCTDVALNATELIIPSWPERGQGQWVMSEHVFDPEDAQYNTATTHCRVFTPLPFLSLSICNTTQSDSPGALTE